MMAHRIRDRTAPIHITLPISLVNKLDATLSYKQSRSKKLPILFPIISKEKNLTLDLYQQNHF